MCLFYSYYKYSWASMPSYKVVIDLHHDFMATRSRSICQHPGCNVLIDVAGRCARHKVVDRDRGSAHQRGYTSAWRKARVAFLRKHPLCVYCERNGITKSAEVVDHIDPPRLKQAIDSGIQHLIDAAKRLFWDSKNWQSLCKRCHDSTKQSEEKADGRY